MSVDYEWCIEEWKDEEIIEHTHAQRISDISRYIPQVDGVNLRLVLIRDSLDKHGSLLEREWAYVAKTDKGLCLPHDFFYGDDRLGVKVPEKFHVEIARIQKWPNQPRQARALSAVNI